MIEKKGELFGIQMLRGFAALAVVIHHVLEASNGSTGRFSPDWLTTAGAAGVDIFFVISGFIMYHTCFNTDRPAPSAASFLKRRVLRIYPMYWICLAAMVVVYAAGFMKSHSASPAQLALSIVLWPGDTLLGVSWTLSYEMLFYLVFAACLLSPSLLIKRAGAVVAVSVLVVLGGSLHSDFLGNPVAIEFCLGILVAGVSHRIKSSYWLAAAATVACLIVFAAPALVPHKLTAGLDGWSRCLCWGLPAALIVAAFVRVPAPASLPSKAAVFLGDASYSLYLTHTFVVIIYSWLLKKTGLGSMPQALPVLMTVVIACLVGVSAYFVVERPLNNVLRQRLKSFMAA